MGRKTTAKRIPHTTTPEFDARLARIQEITGATTQIQLAEALDICQSSISDARRRNSIPAEWLVRLHLSFGAMPRWIMDGEGARTLQDLLPASHLSILQSLTELRGVIATLGQAIDQAIPVARLTLDEFTRAKEQSIDELAEAQETIKKLQGQFDDIEAETAAAAFSM